MPPLTRIPDESRWLWARPSRSTLLKSEIARAYAALLLIEFVTYNLLVVRLVVLHERPCDFNSLSELLLMVTYVHLIIYLRYHLVSPELKFFY